MNFNRRNAEKDFQGKIKLLSNGKAVVEVLDYLNEKIYIDKNNLNGAFNNDIVLVRIIEGSNNYQIKGSVFKIIERDEDIFTGLVFKSKKQLTVIISSTQSKEIILQNYTDELSELDVIKIQIVDWNKGIYPASAKLLKVIALNGQKKSDYLFIINKYKIKRKTIQSEEPSYFKNIIESTKKKRSNLEDLLTFTIDPSSAKDFDDALSIEKTATGYRLYVHIADVGEFVPEGSNIDSQAMIRGNSYYFYEGVSHMLPEYLSENYCSLKENQSRLALTVTIDLGFKGEITNSKINETVINVDKCFSYEQVEEILIKNNESDFLKSLKYFEKISTILKCNRIINGGFEIKSYDINYDLDEKGELKNIKEKESFKSHKIVEECMLLANRVVANKYGEKLKVFRNHSKPSLFGEHYIKNLIYSLTTKNENINLSLGKNIHNFIKDINPIPLRSIFSLLILKKLKKAKYQTFNSGHFGLGFEKYTHFTSPIRRYPDLLVHRFVKASLKKSEYKSSNDINKALEIANYAENNANNANKEYYSIKTLRWLFYNSGKKLDGVILEFKKEHAIIGLAGSQAVKGMLKINNFPADQYKFLDSNIGIKGHKKSNIFKVGQKCKVVVVEVDFKLQKSYLKFSN
ncbi:VacB/RNase II family 3'-5' exoribonuclease [bacterium]|nr:VacB/RNase II family 3'-5' exoribonuclease [bacterium]